MTKRTLATLILTAALGVTLTACASTDDGVPVPTGSNAIAVDPTAEASSQSVEDVAAQIVGMNSADAQAVVEAAGYTWRVGEIDGEPQPVTMDLREDRITVTLEDDIVVAAVVG